MAFELKSTAFKANDAIPKDYTCDGSDRSVPLTWNDPPAGTKSFALIADDPDAPRGTCIGFSTIFRQTLMNSRKVSLLATNWTTGRNKARTTSGRLAMAAPVRLLVGPITTTSSYTR